MDRLQYNQYYLVEYSNLTDRVCTLHQDFQNTLLSSYRMAGKYCLRRFRNSSDLNPTCKHYLKEIIQLLMRYKR